MRRGPRLAGALAVLLLTVVDAPRPIGLGPMLMVRRTLSVNGACPGAEQLSVRAATSVTYCYTVTNTGDTPARDIVVRDGRGSVRVGALARGQSRTVARTLAAGEDADSLAATTGAAGTSQPTATEDAADGVTMVATAGPAPSGAPCAGVEVTIVVAGTTLTGCYTAADAAESAPEGPTTAVAPREPASLIPVGSTPAAATTLQSP